MKEHIKLFIDKNDCCSCGACQNICPKNAITMKADKYGFVYPQINDDLCIGCKMCKRVCAYQNKREENEVLGTYVGKTKNTNILNSASGGIFASIAKTTIMTDGVVFGAALLNENNTLIPKHIMVDCEDNLKILLGSKYVQSDIGLSFREVKKQLIVGKKVLFSGTPCQVAGLKAYLGKDYENLFLIDIICHGVPNATFFQDYIKEVVGKNKILDFKFRDKQYGWTLIGKATFKNNKGKVLQKPIRYNESSYCSLFLNSHIYRENCYTCKYACANRPGDISIGDYWGIENEHPELLKENGGNIDEKRGVSCVIANTKKGLNYVETCDDLELYISDYDKAKKVNHQLVKPSHKSDLREEIMDIYINGGYKAVDKWFKKKEGVNIFVDKIKRNIPSSVKVKIKKIIKRV
ncbi:Coenzyme F420 hydrogenase/dehydrogenase, beta subunit C-terminal domain [Clostridium perfringens]|uniref:Coenzyme F420 hydrogenase/dehydrogenase, beta subunit C-terminal domain n=1 Tax=Clostridium perfringens TaxID=1502 RepID=UPI00290FB975|nr:Coenzyme F420 hydrogenase/dehydrogenase, beta subunit C-terminal domain [Clostridium perfringens]MDK0622139.1 Coenzyme F420 hydrogenase/dehydrogenase, beta subunit C-terminal domain [Clostridium perfringens]MDU5776164.1 Coenzyme F420 hydrogenase/dehydrogenase, beta subunit C-terminal domain [Clostridium perfringens]MDZ5045129.1 4Fe-4S dicluster domain-containing protein [Clostridium perfringens]MDZ5050741.1 4Fe-4S dicluster domain-containing protein [Clostridium perfringens]MDZ5059839.1 4Fe